MGVPHATAPMSFAAFAQQYAVDNPVINPITKKPEKINAAFAILGIAAYPN
jgi:hypothetical protein